VDICRAQELRLISLDIGDSKIVLDEITREIHLITCCDLRNNDMPYAERITVFTVNAATSPS
jgi:hypothetical protein